MAKPDYVPGKRRISEEIERNNPHFALVGRLVATWSEDGLEAAKNDPAAKLLGSADDIGPHRNPEELDDFVKGELTDPAGVTNAESHAKLCAHVYACGDCATKVLDLIMPLKHNYPLRSSRD
jgi:hypothetical protein